MKFIKNNTKYKVFANILEYFIWYWHFISLFIIIIQIYSLKQILEKDFPNEIENIIIKESKIEDYNTEIPVMSTDLPALSSSPSLFELGVYDYLENDPNRFSPEKEVSIANIKKSSKIDIYHEFRPNNDIPFAETLMQKWDAISPDNKSRLDFMEKNIPTNIWSSTFNEYAPLSSLNEYVETLRIQCSNKPHKYISLKIALHCYTLIKNNNITDPLEISMIWDTMTLIILEK